MIKPIFYASVLLYSISMTGEAMADCTTNRVNGGNTLNSLLSGNTICVAKSGGGWESQEEHLANGQLWDYKLGTGDAVDPRKQLGTWSASNGNNAAVTYTYTAFGTPAAHTYQVYSAGGSNYDFCKGSTLVASGTLKSGTGAGCP
ncbi:MAG: hypothetical protein Q7U98_12100 [Methylicorpusculum sp.]|uniref:hypothetical protein n=1 Tax=Methylicorpusculum sp. TaxID=2713644 RepID=UPI002717EA25|nr:hypothetical protein [Methylicorpusculum sp.]MDO8844321.1 hypothetical protein [Methylicorpusculum sp.]MDO8939890.1 hypothetical protein [Methylicorpusculum sp.]MDP2177313.1 hypothetical protein [Methylicorpusculum sp.]MDP2202471.1 hypothetical protein [Methylicorpusculum sp.]MDP3529423.1 hypothetical protein [Methylicorpusculum sp.]